MDDLISRQAMIKDAESWFAVDEHEKHLQKNVVEWLKEFPPAKSEIIRCKDCKHVRKWRSEESAKKFGQIYECARGVFACPNPEDFCSHAEKKTDE